MMKPDDKERIIAEEEAENAQKVPKIQVYTSKALTTTKKPWFPGFLGIALASFAVILSLAVFLTFLGYMGMLPQKVRRNWLVRQLKILRLPGQILAMKRGILSFKFSP